MTVERMVPLYQGMMTTFYDHRAADVVRSETATQRQNQPRYLTDAEKADPTRLAMPQYWVRESLLDPELPQWLIGFSAITSATNERTLQVSVMPRAAIGNSLAIALGESNPRLHCLAACLSSFVTDFLTRQKVGGGTNLNFFYIRQLAVLTEEGLLTNSRWDRGTTAAGWITPRVAELVSTANDMQAVAEQLGFGPTTFRWDPERRFMLRCELDAAFFHLYGVSREDTDYIMDSFPIVQKHDEKEYGEFRTKRVILEIYDAMAEAERTGEPYLSRLHPPPADPRVAHQADCASAVRPEQS